MAQIIKTIRPNLWYRNLLVFGGLFFSGEITRSNLWINTILAFAAFCLMSSATYVFNDLHDKDKDALHHSKRLRPIASGTMPKGDAIKLGAALTTVALGMGVLISPAFVLWLLAYLVVSTAYTLYFKSQMLLDVMAVAAGFLIRVVAGSTVAHVGISPWVLICTFGIAAILVISKRHTEYEHYNDSRDYEVVTIDRMLDISITMTMLAYLLYTFIGSPHRYMLVTAPFVFYGLMKYLQDVHVYKSSPESIFLKDKSILVCTGLWAVTIAVIIYKF